MLAAARAGSSEAVIGRPTTRIEAPAERVPVTGTQLREWRKLKGMTQLQVANQLGVSLRTVELAESKQDAQLGPSIRKNIGRLRAST